jgi:hypothetical protein
MADTHPTHLSDSDLEAELVSLCIRTRATTVALLSHLAEFDRRRLYLGAGFSSLFTYCRGVLRLSESEAYNRIEVARLAARCPAVLEHLRDGSLNLTTARLLGPHLTDESQTALLARAAGKTKAEVEHVVAALSARVEPTARVRKLPARRPERTPAAPPHSESPVGDVREPGRTPGEPALGLAQPAASARRAEELRPVSADQYLVKFIASAAMRDKLRMAQDLLRHAVPDGDVAEVLERGLTVLLADLTRRKCGTAVRPRAGGEPTRDSRRVPAAVRRAVWTRDDGRCAFRAKGGRRCGETGFVEFHHVQPYAAQGKATVDNIELRCRAHNAFEARLFFGTG